MNNSVSSIGLLSTFDIIIAAIIVLLGIKGFMHGFFKEIFGLAGLIVGAYVATRTAEPVARFIDVNLIHLENFSLLKLIAFLSVFILIWFVAGLLGVIFSRMTDFSGLGFLNRLFGFIAGGGKYFLIFAVITAAASNVEITKSKLQELTQDSILFNPLKKTGSYLINLDAKELGIDRFIEKTTSRSTVNNTARANPIHTTQQAAPAVETIPVSKANHAVQQAQKTINRSQRIEQQVTGRSVISH